MLSLFIIEDFFNFIFIINIVITINFLLNKSIILIFTVFFILICHLFIIGNHQQIHKTFEIFCFLINKFASNTSFLNFEFTHINKLN